MNEKKQYEAPRMRAYQVKPQSIIATSSSAGTEEYQQGNTASWY